MGRHLPPPGRTGYSTVRYSTVVGHFRGLLLTQRNRFGLPNEWRQRYIHLRLYPLCLPFSPQTITLHSDRPTYLSRVFQPPLLHEGLSYNPPEPSMYLRLRVPSSFDVPHPLLSWLYVSRFFPEVGVFDFSRSQSRCLSETAPLPRAGSGSRRHLGFTDRSNLETLRTENRKGS